MAETVTNRGKYRALQALMNAIDARLLIFTGTQTGVHEPDTNTVAELDAVTGVSIHTDRIALTTETVTEDDINNRAAYDAANVTFPAAAGVTAQGVALYDEGVGGTDATRDIIAIYTTNFPQPMDGGLTVNIGDLLRAN